MGKAGGEERRKAGGGGGFGFCFCCRNFHFSFSFNDAQLFSVMSDGLLESVTQVEEETSTEVVELLYFFSSILSLLGSGTIILSYFMVKELRRFPFGLVFFLSVCDFFFSIKFFVSSLLLSLIVESSDSSVRCSFPFNHIYSYYHS